MALNQIFQTSELAEDLQFPRLILYTHVMHRSIDLCAGIAVISTATRLAYRRLLPPKEPAKYLSLSQPLHQSFLKASYRGMLIGPVLGAAMTTGLMYNKELIQWQDRSWRLLANKSQNVADQWSLGGLVIGGALGAAMRKKLGLNVVKATLGGAGFGCFVGIVSMILTKKLISAK